MKRDEFTNIMAQWHYAIEHYGQAMPWQVLIYNCTERRGVNINSIELLDDGLKLNTDEGEIKITRQSIWHIKLGRTAQHQTIFTENINFQGELP
jgi:hypothetical protein